MCDLSYRLVYKSNYQDDVQFPFETQVVRTTLFASHYHFYQRTETNHFHTVQNTTKETHNVTPFIINVSIISETTNNFVALARFQDTILTL